MGGGATPQQPRVRNWLWGEGRRLCRARDSPPGGCKIQRTSWENHSTARLLRGQETRGEAYLLLLYILSGLYRRPQCGACLSIDARTTTISNTWYVANTIICCRDNRLGILSVDRHCHPCPFPTLPGGGHGVGSRYVMSANQWTYIRYARDTAMCERAHLRFVEHISDLWSNISDSWSNTCIPWYAV